MLELLRFPSGLRGLLVAVWLLAAGAIAPAAAQEDVQAAARAFRQAQQFQLAGDHASAAELYELADASAPAPEALRSAIRAHVEAGNLARAALLSRRALARYPDDATTAELAAQTLGQARAALGEVVLSCSEPCALLVDGKAITTEPTTNASVFVTPGTHTLQAYWGEGRERERQVDAQAGQQLNEAFEAPAAPEPAAPTTPAAPMTAAPPPAPAAATAPPAGEASSGTGLSPAYFWIAAGTTAAAGAITVITGLDMLDAADAYEDDPTEKRYDRGTGKQTRTNVMIGVTSGLAAVTLGLALFTDWDGERAPQRGALRPTLALDGEGAMLGAEGAF